MHALSYKRIRLTTSEYGNNMKDRMAFNCELKETVVDLTLLPLRVYTLVSMSLATIKRTVLIITRWTCANCTTATSIAWRTF